MRPNRLRLPLMLLLVTGVGCSEEMRVASTPPGAKVFWGDRLVGKTPTDFVVKRAEWRDEFELRLERDGYRPALLTVPTHIAKGRLTGGIFTLGLLWIVKRPTTLPERVDVDLTPEQVAQPVTGAPSAEDRLRVLQRLFDQNLISEEEFRSRRAEVVNGP